MVIKENRPIDLAPGDPGKTGPADPRAEGIEPGGGPGGA
jgi:hypothetical protein